MPSTVTGTTTSTRIPKASVNKVVTPNTGSRSFEPMTACPACVCSRMPLSRTATPYSPTRMPPRGRHLCAAAGTSRQSGVTGRIEPPTHTGDEPDRAELRDREAAHPGDQGRRLEGRSVGDGLQAAGHRAGTLAAGQRPRAECGVSEPLIERPTFSHQACGLWRGGLVGVRSELRGVVRAGFRRRPCRRATPSKAPLFPRGAGGSGGRDGAHRLWARFCLMRSACARLSPAMRARRICGPRPLCSSSGVT